MSGNFTRRWGKSRCANCWVTSKSVFCQVAGSQALKFPVTFYLDQPWIQMFLRYTRPPGETAAAVFTSQSLFLYRKNDELFWIISLDFSSCYGNIAEQHFSRHCGAPKATYLSPGLVSWRLASVEQMLPHDWKVWGQKTLGSNEAVLWSCASVCEKSQSHRHAQQLWEKGNRDQTGRECQLNHWETQIPVWERKTRAGDPAEEEAEPPVWLDQPSLTKLNCIVHI